jgi:hypothetical protein
MRRYNELRLKGLSPSGATVAHELAFEAEVVAKKKCGATPAPVKAAALESRQCGIKPEVRIFAKEVDLRWLFLRESCLCE